MFAAIFTVATLALSVFASAEVSVNTPKAVTTCQEVVITWQNGVAPYSLSVVPGDDPCDAALESFPSTNDTWFHWESPNLTAGTKIIFAVEDATGDEVWSGELTIQAGSTTSCNAPAESTPANSASPSSPVVNPGTGSNISAAPSSKKAGLSVAAAGLVAFLSVIFAL